MTIALTPAQVEALLNEATDILPGNGTPFERALLAAMLHHGLDVPLADLWNPARCPLPLLPYLAWALSVDVWQNEWPEVKKRQVVADSIELHRLKGTLEGLRRYAALADGEVVRAVTPPAMSFLSADLTLADRLAFMERFPEIRIYTLDERGDAGMSLFCGPLDGDIASFDADVDGDIPAFFVESPAALMTGRRARLYENGTVTNLLIVDAVDPSGTVIHGAERYMFPGDGHGASWLDGGPVEQDFFGEAVLPSKVVTVSVGAQHLDGLDGLVAAREGLSPINVAPVRVAQEGIAPDGVFSSTIMDGWHFVESRAAISLYESIRLHDPRVDVIGSGAISFMGYDRFGIDAFTAEVAVSIRETRHEDASDRFVWGYFVETPPTKMHRVLDAMEAARAAHETILVDTEVDRPPLIGGDLFIGAFKIGQPVRG